MKVNTKSKSKEVFEPIELTFTIESEEELSAIYSLFDHSDLIDGFIDPYLGEGFAEKVRNQLDDATEDGVVEGEVFDKLVEVIRNGK